MTSTARRTTFNLQGFFAECEMRTVVGKSNRLRSIDIRLFSMILNYWIKMVEGLNNNESAKWQEPFWNERRKISFSFWRCYSNCEKYKVSASHDKATKVWGRKAFCRSLAGSFLLLFFYIHVKWPKRHSTRPLHTWNQFFFLWKVLNMIEGVMKKYLVEVMKYTFRLIHIQQIWQTSICYDRRFCDNFSIFAL